MTCENCLHYKVCEESGDILFEKGGAEKCYFFLDEKEILHRFLDDLINSLSKTLIDTDTTTC